MILSGACVVAIRGPVALQPQKSHRYPCESIALIDLYQYKIEGPSCSHEQYPRRPLGYGTIGDGYMKPSVGRHVGRPGVPSCMIYSLPLGTLYNGLVSIIKRQAHTQLIPKRRGQGRVRDDDALLPRTRRCYLVLYAGTYK